MASMTKAERARSLAKRARDKAGAVAKAQQHTLIAAGTAYGIGMAEKRGMNLPAPEGVDPKLLYGAVALGFGYMAKGQQLRRIGQSVGDGLLSIVAYEWGKTKISLGYDDDSVY